ncbi:MAG: histone deacetylase [Actinomycetia bacterium]|nr:histone deacetylase [Actinomycetes bacterium]MCP4961601.1 histone deacetylase [Actinomycetes bacterium]
MSDLVWYASFGSNLRRERFMYYLRGGVMEGQEIGHSGARDPSDPADTRLWKAPHQLRFGGESIRWGGGGVAFVHPDRGSGEAFVRLWKISAEQFCDVAAQENGLTPGELDVDVEAVEDSGHADITGRWYGRVLCLGRVDDHPVFTFTSPVVREPSAPSVAYASMLMTGLVEMGVGAVAAASYLMEAPGVADRWTAHALVDLTIH